MTTTLMRCYVRTNVRILGRTTRVVVSAWEEAAIGCVAVVVVVRLMTPSINVY